MNDLFFKFIEKLGSIDNTLLFAVSIIPYAIFLFFLYKIKSVNNFVKTGFSITVLFVLITILVSIFTLNYYDKTLVEVDFLHGFAESFLTLSDFGIIDTANNNVLSIEPNFSIIFISKSFISCLLYTSPSPRDRYISRMPSSA